MTSPALAGQAHARRATAWLRRLRTTGISATTRPPNRTIARSQASAISGKLRSEEQHRRPRRREFPNQSIDLAFRANIDAAGGIEAQERVEPGGEPARDHDFLLVAAAQSAQLRTCAGIDLKAFGRGIYARSLSCAFQSAPNSKRPPKAGNAMFSRNRTLLQERQQPVGRHEDDAFSNCVRRMPEFQFLAMGEDGALIVAAIAGDAVEQFLLPLALQRRHAKDLAGIEFERNVVEQADCGASPRTSSALAHRAAPLGVRSAWRRTRTAPAVSAPSISATMRSSLPCARSVTPTVTPSRSTVARSHKSATSAMRWEMKITALPRSRQCLTIA